MSIAKIATKFLVSVSLLVIFTAVLLSFMFTRHALTKTADAQRDYADSLARTLAYNAEYGVLTKNFHLLETLIKGIVADQRITRIEILDIDGNPLYAYGKNTLNEYTSHAAILSASTARNRAPAKQTNESILLFASNEDTGRRNTIGEVRLSLSLNDLHIQLAKIRSRVVLTTFLVALCGILIVTVLVKKITAPLEELVSATATIANGNLDHHVAVKTADEIGQLAAAFNRMTDELSRTVVSRAYVNNIIQSMMDMLVVVNTDNTIRTVNQAARDLLGYREEELVGKPADIIFAGQSKDAPLRIADRLHAISRRDVVRNMEEAFVTKTGELIPVLLSASPMKTDKGAPLGIVFAALDIRERIKAEKEKTMMTERLMHSEKMAAMGQLASGITHEINNPLGVILGFAQTMLKSVPEYDPLYASLAVIEREASRCRNIVTEMLAFSRVKKIDKEPHDIHSVISSALMLVEARTKNTYLKVVRDFDLTLPPVMVNSNQIQQVVINLCNNAIDAMGKTGQLTIRTVGAVRNSKQYIELQFKDTGHGVPKELQHKIFEPLFTTKEDGTGTGLGLALVYEIVQRHDGLVELDSESGRGALFRILLPL